MCDCHKPDALGFKGWKPFQEYATEELKEIKERPGIYCLRVANVGVADPKKIQSRILTVAQPLLEAFARMWDASEQATNESARLFAKCGLGSNWGFEYVNIKTAMEEDLKRIDNLPPINDGKLHCPILYFGRGKNVKERVENLMTWGHNFSVPLWALVNSKWTIELAIRYPKDHKAAEKKVCKQYRNQHDNMLPPFMIKC